MKTNTAVLSREDRALLVSEAIDLGCQDIRAVMQQHPSCGGDASRLASEGQVFGYALRNYLIRATAPDAELGPVAYIIREADAMRERAVRFVVFRLSQQMPWISVQDWDTITENAGRIVSWTAGKTLPYEGTIALYDGSPMMPKPWTLSRVPSGESGTDKLDKKVVIDIETTGLDVERNVVLEVGIVVAHADGTVIDTWSAVVSNNVGALAAPATNDFVRKMHEDNGLRAEAKAMLARGERTFEDEVEAEAVAFLAEHDALGYPMAGSSIGSLDRPMLARHMPKLADAFHYRNDDASTKRLLLAQLGYEVNRVETENAAHRAVDDALASLRLLTDIEKGLKALLA